MAKEILYTTALDEKENLIHIDNAEKSISYFCPGCKGVLILRKSGNIGKGSKRPHFAHNKLTTNCTPEGVLHLSFKKLSIDLLESYLSENKGLEINWNCATCSNHHKGNLLENITFVKEEYNLKVCRPDIALLDEEENVIAVIEIVVTHAPEESAIQYYSENNIVLIQINLSSEDNLNNVHGGITNQDTLSYCLNPYCSTNERKSIKRKYVAKVFKCGRCYRERVRYYIEANSVFGKLLFSDFADEQIEYIKSKVPGLTVMRNKSTNEKYPVSICSCMRRSNYRARRL